MEAIQDNLFLYEYWRDNIPTDWSILDYFMKLTEKTPETNRRTGNRQLLDDLENLYIFYMDDTETKKIIATLKNNFKKLTKSNAELINHFWNDHSQSLSQDVLKTKIAESKTRQASKRKANSLVTADIESMEPSSSRKTSTAISVERKNEVDQVYVKKHVSSIGTVIKKKAIDLHTQMNNGKKLTIRQRKIMTNGLSSILDLSDDSYGSQRSLFCEEDWASIQEHFADKTKIKLEDLDEKVTDNITIVYNTLGLSNDPKCCARLVSHEAELMSLCIPKTGLNLLKTYLKIMYKYPNMLTKTKSAVKVTELDYLRCIWCPVFEVLFPPQNQLIRIKTGESINPTSTKKKYENYCDNTHIKGFKIDFRFLVDQSDGSEIDLGIGECALDDADDKAVSDEGKLAREGKDSLDELINIVPECMDATPVWIIQTTGTHCSLSTIHLQKPGLYTIQHRYSFNIPFSERCIRDCGPSIQWLLKMREQLLDLHSLIVKYTTIQYSNNTSFNRRERQKENPKLSYVRDTYYTPPRNTTSKLPAFMYGPPPIYNNPALDIPTTPTTNLGDKGGTDILEFDGAVDIYGYRRLTNGGYYNIFTKKTSSTHPLENI